MKPELALVVFCLSCLPFTNQRLIAQPSNQDSKNKTEDSSKRELPNIASFYPTPKLKVPSTKLTKAKFPAIDIHSHFGIRIRGDREALQKYVEVMDRNQIAISNSLDARLGSETEHINFLAPHANRFSVFAHIDFQGKGTKKQPAKWSCNQAGFVREVCEKLKVAKKSGIHGVKFFKGFGLGYPNSDGTLIKIDDRRFDPIWKTCGNLKLPVIIHTGDPAAFFDPIDETNERYEELFRRPEWSFHGDRFPSRSELLEARNRVIARHPGTQFIGAHMGGNPEDLSIVGTWLDKHPNLVVEFSSRIGELGRQPFTARDFFIKYQDRILFGTDGPWPEERLHYYWRFLESRDEYFPYSEKRPQPQGLWFIYGINLPDAVLEKIYYQNALRILPQLKTQYKKIGDAPPSNDK